MNKFTFVLSTLILLSGFSNLANAYAEPLFDDYLAQITTKGDIYVKSKSPTAVSFDVKANDASGLLNVQCDKTSGSVFKVGKTTVRCMANTLDGRSLRTSFVVTVGYDVVQIPNWFKQTTKLWASQNISDKEYVDTLRYMLDNNLIKVPYSKSPKAFSNLDIPVWIKTNSQKWTDDKLSNDEFSIGIQWMLERGVISYQKTKI